MLARRGRATVLTTFSFGLWAEASSLFGSVSIGFGGFPPGWPDWVRPEPAEIFDCSSVACAGLESGAPATLQGKIISRLQEAARRKPLRVSPVCL